MKSSASRPASESTSEVSAARSTPSAVKLCATERSENGGLPHAPRKNRKLEAIGMPGAPSHTTP